MRHVKPVTVAKANSWNDFWDDFGDSWRRFWGKDGKDC
jgi:hypothetical protein